MQSYVIGIDLGTGSAKAIAMNYTGEILETAQVAYPTLQPQPDFAEQAPELIWQAFVKCISRITTRMAEAPEAVCLSSAMHSLIPMDKNGNALMNMITWADNRSASIAMAIHESASGQPIYEQSGTPIHAMTPLCKIVWLQQNEPDIFGRTTKFISIKEYVWLRLFNEYEVDYSIASATGLMNIHTRQWNDESLKTAGIGPAQLSMLVNTNYKRTCADKTLCAQLGITKDTRFFIGASDGCLANIGSFATEEGFMAVTIGTSGAVRVACGTPMVNFKAMTFSYLLDESTYICGGPINNGGVALKWYANNLLGRRLESAQDYSELLNALNKTKPGAEGLIFLPYILGERAPIWNSHASGTFFGMRSHHAQAHFTRAVVEGISASLYDVAQNMSATGLEIRQLQVSGGFIHSEEWMQLLADLFGKKVCLITTEDASAVGATYLAMKNLGIIDGYAALKPSETKEFIPNPTSANAYREMYSRYRNTYDHVESLMVPPGEWS